jgi:hypothetical protein
VRCVIVLFVTGLWLNARYGRRIAMRLKVFRCGVTFAAMDEMDDVVR